MSPSINPLTSSQNYITWQVFLLLEYLLKLSQSSRRMAIDNSVCKMSWKVVQNWQRNPRNQPFKPSRCIKASFYIPENLIFLQLGVLEWIFPWNWFRVEALHFTHLKLCLATATHNFKWVKIHSFHCGDPVNTKHLDNICKMLRRCTNVIQLFCVCSGPTWYVRLWRMPIKTVPALKELSGMS